MPKFSPESSARLAECHEDLQELFGEVIKSFDCQVTKGYRGPVEQHAAFTSGKSKLDWPKSLHNRQPSAAIDVYPYPIDFQDIKRFYYFAGFVLGVADQLRSVGLISHAIRWGGDWDSDTEVKDNRFNDLCHFEIVGE